MEAQGNLALRKQLKGGDYLRICERFTGAMNLSFCNILSQRSQLFSEIEVNGIPVPLEINKKRIYFTYKY